VVESARCSLNLKQSGTLATIRYCTDKAYKADGCKYLIFITQVIMADLYRLFHPRSVAVVGISADPGKWGGHKWIEALLEFEFKGRIYPISRTISEFKGLRTYPSVEAVPDSIDLVVVSIPARFTPQLMDECARKGVGFIQFFTAGFSEIGGDGSVLEREVVENANMGGVRIVGPNCMGVYCPNGRFSWRVGFPKESGGVAFLSQSGWNANDTVKLGAVRGLRFNKVISYGNAADLNETDFLDYFTADKESRIITAYIEGVKDGQRFIQVLRKAAQAKPVIVLKGGRSQAGARAATSHTASLAGASMIWESALRQAGAIEVHSLDELVDVTLAFQCLPVIESNGVALIGAGGGTGVIGADECEEAGLAVPPLPEETMRSLHRFIPQEGTGLRNPVDTPFRQTGQQFQETIAIVASRREIACLIIHLQIDNFLQLFGERELANWTNALVAIARDCTKPVIVVLRTSAFPEAVKAILEQQLILVPAGIPVYPTIRRAAQAISMVLRQQRSRP
jgi:acyl-CoA synthetase (NDP forming)